MSSQRLISDARRRAKQLARVSGRPHQTHLDEIARECGRLDWRHFLDDPVAVGDAPSSDPRVEEVRKAPDHDATVREIMRFGVRGTILATLGMAAMATFVVSDVRHIPFPNGFSDTVIGVISLISVALVMMVVMPALMVAMIAAMVSFAPQSWTRHARPSGDILARMWKATALRVAIGVAIPSTAAVAVPAMMTSVPLDDVTSYQADMDAGRILSFADRPRAMAYRPLRDLGDGRREIMVAVVDQRISPRSLRAHARRGSIDPQIGSTFGDHPVLRARGAVDCSSGYFMPSRLETADSMTSPAIATAFRNRSGGPSKRFRLNERSRLDVCGGPARATA